VQFSAKKTIPVITIQVLFQNLQFSLNDLWIGLFSNIFENSELGSKEDNIVITFIIHSSHLTTSVNYCVCTHTYSISIFFFLTKISISYCKKKKKY
jgi:hypothetical protein